MAIFLFCVAYVTLSFFVLLLVRIAGKPVPTPPLRIAVSIKTRQAIRNRSLQD